MSSSTNQIAIIGAGPAGMAAGLALIKVGHDVVIFERYPEVRPAGNILNLWPPPIKALREMGVDTTDLGAGCHSTFRNAKGHVRADVQIPEDVVEEFGGGFIGMLRPDLYTRMHDALPAGTIRTNKNLVSIEDRGTHVTLTFADGEVFDTPVLIGADGIDSFVRTHLWGPSKKREHNLQVISGYTYNLDVPLAEPNEAIVAHNATIMGAYTSIRSHAKSGYQWWVCGPRDGTLPPPTDLVGDARTMARGFAGALNGLIEATPTENLRHWVIRDRKPLKKWSVGRVTIAGDAAHATSPYAAYGAGMSIGDGYFLANALAGIDLSDRAAVEAALVAYETPRIPHTTEQVNAAFMLGKIFHHTPAPLRPLRDLILDRTRFLQRQVGEENPKAILAQLEEMRGLPAPA